MVKEHEYEDTVSIVTYFLECSEDDYDRMGVDPGRLPPPDEWIDSIEQNRALPFEKKNVFYLIWTDKGLPIGHCNINKIKFGEEAYMHLHIWKNEFRKKTIATKHLKESIPVFFKHFNLKRLYCEPAAANPAPNHTLKKLKFTLTETYDTVPGWINHFQTVNKWMFSLENIDKLNAE
jgi:RimJ/RimL family protein N-acetyltransferase